jgi:DUF4097 and DUF4098 domain-containing protein YvlB
MNKKFSAVMIAIWSVIALALIGILVFFIVCGHNFNMSNWNFKFNGANSAQTQYVNKSFTAPDISEINVNAKSADVSFSKTQSDEIKVSITGSENSNSKDMYTVSQSGGVLQITQDYNWGFSFFFFGPFNQHISITLPESYKKDLALKLTSGDITFNGDYTFGKADIYKTSGDLVAGSITADTFTLKSTSGDTSISKLNASYEIHSTSGDMKFDSLEGYGSIGSISGNIECNISKLSGAFGISATSGNINIGLSQSVGADIKADTTSGDVNADFAMSYSGRNHATANVGSSPYNKLAVSVTSGNINFTQN